MSQGHAIFSRLREPIAERLRKRAKGYSGKFRQELEDAAYVIEQYQSKKPFEDCVSEHAFMFAGVGFEAAAKIAEEKGAVDVAVAIRSEAEKQFDAYSTPESSDG